MSDCEIANHALLIRGIERTYSPLEFNEHMDHFLNNIEICKGGKVMVYTPGNF